MDKVRDVPQRGAPAPGLTASLEGFSAAQDPVTAEEI
jgi:hypothetical protein